VDDDFGRTQVLKLMHATFVKVSRKNVRKEGLITPTGGKNASSLVVDERSKPKVTLGTKKMQVADVEITNVLHTWGRYEAEDQMFSDKKIVYGRVHSQYTVVRGRGFTNLTE